MSIAFKRDLLGNAGTLPIENAEVRTMIETLVQEPGTSPDKRFVYYLLAATGICTVPLSSFSTAEQGFRITLLERDEKEFTNIFKTIAKSITAYLKSNC